MNVWKLYDVTADPQEPHSLSDTHADLLAPFVDAFSLARAAGALDDAG